MDKRTAVDVNDHAEMNIGSSDQWQALSDLELACVGGGIGDTVL